MATLLWQLIFPTDARSSGQFKASRFDTDAFEVQPSAPRTMAHNFSMDRKTCP
jgi:hypothetical protein